MTHLPSAPRDRWWGALSLAWPLGLYAVLLATVAGLGFNPTDEGVVSAAARRVLGGQIPHLDFATPRPALSAYLHAPELLLPTPAFITGRAVALAQIIAYSILLAWFILDQAPTRWRLTTMLGVAASVVVNLNTFPLMPWYTIDGLLFVAAGLVLLRRGLADERLALIGIAFGLFGLATLSKQSFAPALAFGFAWVIAGSPSGRRLTRALVAAIAGAIPLVSYAGAIALAGGTHELVRQLLASEPIFGYEITTPLNDIAPTLLLAILPAALAVVRGTTLVPAPQRAWTVIGIAAVLTILVLVVLAGFGLLLTAPWSILLVWILGTLLVADGLVTKRVDARGLLLIGLAWMTGISYGLPVPSLVGGSLALALLHRTWRAEPWGWMPRAASAATTVGFATFFVVALALFASGRTTYAHRDLPPPELTQELGSISVELSGIRTGPPTAEYLRGMKSCVDDHPARSVAVLPDNAAAYVAFDWHNPLPVDFFYPPEYAGARDQVLRAADELAEHGDFLVLFQVVRADALADAPERPPGDVDLHAYDRPLTDALIERLAPAAEDVECYPFEGLYAPGVSAAARP